MVNNFPTTSHCRERSNDYSRSVVSCLNCVPNHRPFKQETEVVSRLLTIYSQVVLTLDVFQAMQSRKVLIPCTVHPGMFRDEFAVEIETGEGTITLFADRSLLQEHDGRHYLEVSVVEENGRQQRVQTVLLPSESFEKGTRWLRLPTEALLEPA